MKVVIYSCDVGGHDGEWPVVEQEHHSSWDVEVHRLLGSPIARLNDRLAARWAKTHPHVLFPDADLTIWIDASIEVISPRFAADVQRQARHYTLLRHPDRTTVREEVEAAATLSKYGGTDHIGLLMALDAFVGNETWQTEAQLWAMTVIARRNTPITRIIDELTWSFTRSSSGDDYDATVLDQLILPALASQLDSHVITAWPNELKPPNGGDLWNNEWFVRHAHLREG